MRAFLIVALLLIATNVQANPTDQLRSQYNIYQIAQKIYPEKLERVKGQIVGKRKMSKGVARFVRKYLDWDTYAELSFRDWDKLNKKEQRKLVWLLKELTIKRYAEFFSPSKKYMVQFKESTEYKIVRNDMYARVKALVTVWESEAEVEVGFLLRDSGNGWSLCDVYIDGVSKARAYRSALRKVYKKRGFDGVEKILKKNIKKVQKKT